MAGAARLVAPHAWLRTCEAAAARANDMPELIYENRASIEAHAGHGRG